MKKVVLFLNFFIVLPLYQGFCQPVKPGYVCVLNEEFNGSSLDESYWKIAHGLVRGSCGGEKGYCRPQNIEISNGTMKIHTRKETFTDRFVSWLPDTTRLECHGRQDPNGEYINLMEWNYSTGEIYTYQRFKFGYFEIRCRLADGAGHNNAFWLYGPGPTGGKDEIDFFEIFGDRDNQLHTDIHCNTSACDVGGWVDLGPDQHIFSQFHTYAGYWDHEKIIFFYDGREIDRYYKDFGCNQNLIIGVGMGGGFAGSIDDSALPSRMEVDYVRVYKRLIQNDIIINDFNNTTYCNVFANNNIKISDGNDNIVIDGIDYDWQHGNYMDCYATNSIKILPNFHAEYGSYFKAKLVDNFVPATNSLPTNEMTLKSVTEGIVNSSDQSVINEENKIIIYPNPITDYFIVQMDIQNNHVYHGHIINTLGKTVKTFLINGSDSKINIENLPSGLYLIEINLSDSIFNYKFIKR